MVIIAMIGLVAAILIPKQQTNQTIEKPNT
jgi:hypothetical protein